MRKVLLLAGVACLAAANVSAFEFNPYVSAKAKYALSRNEVRAKGMVADKANLNDNVWGGAVALGNTFYVNNGDFRFEVEYTKNADAEKDNVKVKTQAVLFNAYYDFNLRTVVPVKPYVGAGLGWGEAKFAGDHHSAKDDGAALHIGAGINYQICDRTNIDLGYRYITYNDFDVKYKVGETTYEKIEYRPHAHEILLGVRYDF